MTHSPEGHVCGACFPLQRDLHQANLKIAEVKVQTNYRIMELKEALDDLLTAIGKFVDEHDYETYWQYNDAVKQARKILGETVT